MECGVTGKQEERPQEKKRLVETPKLKVKALDMAKKYVA